MALLIAEVNFFLHPILHTATQDPFYLFLISYTGRSWRLQFFGSQTTATLTLVVTTISA